MVWTWFICWIKKISTVSFHRTLLIIQLNAYIENNWSCCLQISRSGHYWVDSNCPSYWCAQFLTVALNIFQTWHQNVTKQSGKAILTAGTESVHNRCSVCNKSCRTARGLLLHEGLHRGIYPYTCPYCGRGFSGNSNLRGHLVVHTGVKEFNCDICKRAFRYAKDLRRHQRIGKTCHT